jgi:hypothetical protein
MPWLHRDNFKANLRIFEAPVVSVTLQLKLLGLVQQKDQISCSYRKTGAVHTYTDSDFDQKLIGDLAFGLQLHRERISVQGIEAPWVNITVSRLEAASDFPIKRREGMLWRSWEDYFGKGAKPQHLVTVAQTFRDKMIMVGDDLSDIYKQKVTSCAEEGKFTVIVSSPSCQDFETTFAAHRMVCVHANGPGELAGQHSMLYEIVGKDKVDNSDMVEYSSLPELYRRKGQAWPDQRHLETPARLESQSDRAIRGQYRVSWAGGSSGESSRSIAEGAVADVVKKAGGFDVVWHMGCRHVRLQGRVGFIAAAFTRRPRLLGQYQQLFWPEQFLFRSIRSVV